MKCFAPVFGCRAIPKVAAQINKARFCPLCGAGPHNHVPLTDMGAPPTYILSCSLCGYSGPEATNMEDAIAAWNDTEHATYFLSNTA